MAMLVLAGRYANFIERLAGLSGASGGLAGGVPIIASSADADFGVSYLTDGILHHPFRWSALTADPMLTFDLSPVPNSGFEKDGAAGVSPPSNWAYGNGTSFATATDQKRNGNYAGKLTANNNSGYVLVPVRSGERGAFFWSIRGDGTAQAQAFCRNLTTGKYLNLSTGAWQAGASLDTQTSATWRDGSRATTIESYSDTRSDVCMLQLAAQQSGSGSTWYDDFVWVPEVDFAAAFGHNWRTFAPELRYDAGAFAGAGTQVAGAFATVYEPSMYASFASVAARFWRLKLTGTPTELPWIGKLWLGQRTSLARHHDYGDARERDDSGQIRGTGRALVLTDQGRRIWSPRFQLNTDAEYAALDEVMRRARHGGHQSVLVPYDMPSLGDSNVCLVGRWQEPRFAFTHDFMTVRRTALEFVEDPYPSWAAA